MTNNILALRGLNKHYGTLHAVQDLSFTVQRGEIFGILGPNGSGKTTTLECILGTRSRDSGSVSVLGMDPVAQRREVFRRVGVQFQDSAWQPAITVQEMCEATACLYRPVPDWEPLLVQFDLAKRRKKAAESLSGGERQKLSILLACIHSPEVVFLDELTTGLDPLARRETWRFIKKLQDQGTAVVLTSHFMDEVEHLCQRGIILKDGKKIAEGTIAELIAAGQQTMPTGTQGTNGIRSSLEEAYIHLIGGAL